MLAEMGGPQTIRVKQLDEDVLRKSITKHDQPASPQQGGVWHFLIPVLGSTGNVDLPPFWTIGRDWVLYQTIYRESQWANAVAKAISKMAAKSVEVAGEVPMRVRKAREMLLSFDLDRGWVPGLAKHLQSFLLTGNGSFIEVVHQTSAAGSKVLGLVHLDTFRCMRTGDLEHPVIYRDRHGGEHILRDHQVIYLSDMPDQAELWNGVGHCAAERAYSAILRMESLERYVYEKVSGRRPLALHITNTSKQLIEDGIAAAKNQREAQGLASYMGAVVIPLTDPTATPNVATIDLANLPDGFNPEQERKNAYLVYANAIGIDPQMLDPSLVASRNLGSGTQARILAEKQEALGLAAWDKAFSHAINEKSLDEKTTFIFREVDLADTERKTQISLLRSQVIGGLMMAQVLTRDQGIQLLVDWDELPEEFLPVDQTPDTTLTDEIKPEGDAGGTSLASPAQAPALPAGGFGSEADVVLASMRRVIDNAISKAHASGAKSAMDSYAMQELILAVKSLAESTDQPPAPIVVNVPEQKEHPAPVVHVHPTPLPPIHIEPTPIQVNPTPVQVPPSQVKVNVVMPEYETEIVRDRSGRAVRSIHRWVPPKES